jgi:hypothetical protein
MRKKMILLLIIPIILIAIVSCDLDSLSDFMGSMGGNVYSDLGLVEIDTSQGAAVSGAIGNILDPAIDEEAYKEQVEKMLDSFSDALQSEQKKEALKKDMAKPAPKDENTGKAKVPKIAQDLLGELNTKTGLDISTDDIETEGDLAAILLITEFYDKVKDVDPDDDDFDMDDALEAVSEALEILEIIDTISPTGSILIDDILEELFGDSDLMEQLFRGSRSSSRSSRDGGGDDIDPMAIIEPIFKTIINGIGKDSNGDINAKELKRAIVNYGIMRATYEKMAPLLEKSGKTTDLGDIINYMISVVFTEADAFFKSIDDEKDFEGAINAIIEWLENENRGNYRDYFGDGFDWNKTFEDFTENEARFEEDGTIATTIRLLAKADSESFFDDALIDEMFGN